MYSAKWRTRISAPPPGASGTIILIVLADCDHAPWPAGDNQDGEKSGEYGNSRYQMQELSLRIFVTPLLFTWWHHLPFPRLIRDNGFARSFCARL